MEKQRERERERESMDEYGKDRLGKKNNLEGIIKWINKGRKMWSIKKDRQKGKGKRGPVKRRRWRNEDNY